MLNSSFLYKTVATVQATTNQWRSPVPWFWQESMKMRSKSSCLVSYPLVFNILSWIFTKTIKREFLNSCQKFLFILSLFRKLKWSYFFQLQKKKDLEGTFSIHSICSFKQHGFIIIQIDITFAHICICPYSLLWGKKTHASL